MDTPSNACSFVVAVDVICLAVAWLYIGSNSLLVTIEAFSNLVVAS